MGWKSSQIHQGRREDKLRRVGDKSRGNTTKTNAHQLYNLHLGFGPGFGLSISTTKPTKKNVYLLGHGPFHFHRRKEKKKKQVLVFLCYCQIGNTFGLKLSNNLDSTKDSTKTLNRFLHQFRIYQHHPNKRGETVSLGLTKNDPKPVNNTMT